MRHHLLMHLDRRFNHRKQPRVLFKKMRQVAREVRLMLSAFASASHIGSILENERRSRSSAKRKRHFNWPFVSQHWVTVNIPTQKPEAWTADQLEACMRSLHQASMEVKRQFLVCRSRIDFLRSRNHDRGGRILSGRWRSLWIAQCRCWPPVGLIQ